MLDLTTQNCKLNQSKPAALAVVHAPEFQPFSHEELAAARLAPTCFVENYLYADLALVCAAGGTGKTTMLIHEAVCIALGFPVWGNRVAQPGKTLFITAEDSRELFAARLREVMDALRLTDVERARAVASIAVWDVSDQVARLACLDSAGNIQLTTLADDIVATFKDQGIVQVVFDPAISFGPGERLVNDAEQAVVLAARRIIRGLNCCVRITHHTGKANARNGAIDQYAGRGGSAFADGARMVTILSTLGDDSPFALPDGFTLQEGESGFILARAKLSYCAPQPNIFIRRSGYHFDHVIEERISKDELATRDAATIDAFLVSELDQGRRYTARSLEDSGKTGLTRQRLRAALAILETSERILTATLPKEQQRGARKTYLHPCRYCAKPSGAIDEKPMPSESAKSLIAPSVIIAPPYREKENGAIDAVSLSPDSPIAPNLLAQYRRNGAIEETIPPESTKVTSEGLCSVGSGNRTFSPDSRPGRILTHITGAGAFGARDDDIARHIGGNGKKGATPKLIQMDLAMLRKAGVIVRQDGRWIATGSDAHG
ncbi:MAG: AAA family ATPase [Candidatus Competibacteraceae bacterium]|nr:AAA family ATPase [Candidatus Competibacteraceae bacterium]